MKEDITQHDIAKFLKTKSCGLVMKEDITQQIFSNLITFNSCGLVMKEDITQRQKYRICSTNVVVW